MAALWRSTSRAAIWTIRRTAATITCLGGGWDSARSRCIILTIRITPVLPATPGVGINLLTRVTGGIGMENATGSMGITVIAVRTDGRATGTRTTASPSTGTGTVGRIIIITGRLTVRRRPVSELRIRLCPPTVSAGRTGRIAGAIGIVIALGRVGNFRDRTRIGSVVAISRRGRCRRTPSGRRLPCHRRGLADNANAVRRTPRRRPVRVRAPMPRNRRCRLHGNALLRQRRLRLRRRVANRGMTRARRIPRSRRRARNVQSVPVGRSIRVANRGGLRRLRSAGPWRRTADVVPASVEVAVYLGRTMGRPRSRGRRKRRPCEGVSAWLSAI